MGTAGFGLKVCFLGSVCRDPSLSAAEWEGVEEARGNRFCAPA